MKKNIHFLLLLHAILLPVTALAHDFEVDGIYYDINGNEATVSYRGTSYYQYSNEYSGFVTIPTTVTYGGTTYSVTSIGSHAFYGCSGLTSITIPSSVTSIGDFAFSGCNGLKSIVVESGNPTYDSRNNCNAIIETSSNTLLKGCQNTIIPNSVTTIGNYAFSGCTGLTSVNIPNSVTSIGECAFLLSGLTNVTIPNSVTSIGSSAFAFCTGLTDVTIGDSVTSIGNEAFYDCEGLTSITIPNSVTTIGENAFSKCRDLTNVTIGNSVTSISDGAFNSCSGLTSVTVESGNPKYDSRNNCNAIIETATNTLISGCKTTIIPNSVTTIGPSAFYGCSRLNSIDIPNSVTSIGESAFSYCNGLNNVFSFIDDPTTISMGSDVFYRNPNYYTSRTLHVPEGTVSAYLADTNWSQYFGSIVEIVHANSIELDQASAELYEGETLQLTATVMPEDAIDKTVAWKSSKPSVATVSSTGFVTALSAGSATITATTTDGNNMSATCAITVKAYVTSLSFDPSEVTILEGDTITLIPTILPTYATNQGLYWSSNNTSVATVNNGVVIGRSGGEATITARTADGSNLSATCKVTVVPNFDISAPNLSHIRGSDYNKYDLTIDLANRYDITGMQLDIQFPDGVTIAKDIDGEYDILLDDARKTRNHTATASQISYNTYRILVSSATANILKGHNGTVLHIMIEIPISHVSGNKQIKYSNIILSEPDETRHTLPTKYSLISYYYLEGDANADVNVDVADYVITGNFILQNSPENFWYDAANVDHNNTIDVNDLTGITNIALGRREGGILQMPAIQTLEYIVLTADPLQIQAGQTQTLNLSLDGNYAFAGFQMDMQLPRGIKLVDASLTDQNSDLSIATAELPDGSIRLLASSFSLKDLVVSNTNFLKLTLMTDNSFYGDDTITLGNIKFSERNMVLHTIDGVVIPVGNNVSALEHIYGEIRIYPEGNNIIIDTPESGTARIITISGITYVREVLPGHNVIPMNDSGFYIVTLNGKTAKLRLK